MAVHDIRHITQDCIHVETSNGFYTFDLHAADVNHIRVNQYKDVYQTTPLQHYDITAETMNTVMSYMGEDGEDIEAILQFFQL